MRILTKSGVCGHVRICWRVSLSEPTGQHSFGRRGVDACHFLVEWKRERQLSEKTPVLFFFFCNRERGDATGHWKQLVVPKIAWTHHTCTERQTHTLSMKNDTVESLVTFKPWSPVKLCCCGLICPDNTCTTPHPHTHVSLKRDDLEHNVNSRHWLES